MRLSLCDSLPSLLVPCRLDVFAVRAVRGKRGTVKPCGVGWQAWNADPVMERRMARLAGTGSFYWPNGFRGYMHARVLMTYDTTIHQIKIETINGREIGRLYR